MDKSHNTRISPEMLTAISAVFIGLCAIGVSLYETSLISESQKGAAWPNLDGGYGYNQEGFRYLIQNTGLGPAKIKYVYLTLDDKPVVNWVDFMHRLGLPFGDSVISHISNRVLAPQQQLEVFFVPSQESGYKLFEARNRVKWEICYCSVYDDCWITAIEEPAREVSSCDSEGKTLFTN